MDHLELQALASELGLQFDEFSSLVFGQIEGYTLYIEPTERRKQYRICFSVKAGDAFTAPNAFDDLIKNSEVLTSSQLNHYKLNREASLASLPSLCFLASLSGLSSLLLAIDNIKVLVKQI